MKLKSLLACGLAALALSTAQAVEFQFDGSTAGTFSAQPPGLTFTGSSFSHTTAFGFTAVDNLGVITLANSPAPLSSSSFSLEVTFTLPTNIAPDASPTYTAVLTGGVLPNGSGGYQFNFDNTPQFFTFDGGQFQFSVNDVSVNVGETRNVTGQITASGVPDGGATVALLGLAFVGVAAVRSKLQLA